MTRAERQSPPAANRGASNVIYNGDHLSLTALDDIAHHVDGASVVVVETPGGKYRRRCFLTAASAERAAGRAMDRGENATVYLAELKPLWKLQGGRLDPEPDPELVRATLAAFNYNGEHRQAGGAA